MPHIRGSRAYRDLHVLFIIIVMSLSACAPLFQVAASSEEASIRGELVSLSWDLYVNAWRLDEFLASASVTGTLDVLVIFVYFTDVYPSVGLDTLTARLSDATRYYSEVSYGQAYLVWWSYNWSDPWLQLPNTMDYYGAPSGSSPDGRQLEFIQDSLAAADPFVDYTRFKYVLIVHAGGDEAMTGDPNDIWSFAVWGGTWSTDDGTVQLDIAVVSESDPLGVIVHELGHNVFRWPDLYDYSYTKEFVGHWGLMAAGSWNGPWGSPGSSPAHPISWCRLKAGWISTGGLMEVGFGELLEVNLTVLEDPSGVKAVKIPLDQQHYYLIEARARRGFDSYLPGEGVLILYVDETLGSGEGIVRVIDSTPGDGDVDDGQWLPGMLYSDDANDLRVYIVSGGGDYYTLRIEYGLGAPPKPEISVRPGSAPPGVYVEVSGEGFSPSASVNVYLGNELVASGIADSAGSFKTTFRVPSGTAPGDYIVRAVDEYGLEATVNFTVTQASATISPATASPGDTVELTASGLGAGVRYLVLLDSMLLGMMDSGAGGELVYRFTLPPLSSGDHNVCLVHPGNWSYSDWVSVVCAQLTVVDGIVYESLLDARLAELRSYVDAQLSLLSSSVEDLSRELRLINETLSSNLSALELRVDELDESIAAIWGSLESINSSLTALMDYVNQLEGIVLVINATLSSVELEIDAINATLQAINGSLGSVNETLALIQDRIDKLNKTVFAVSIMLEMVKSELEDRIDMLEYKLTDLSTRLSNLGYSIAALKKSLEKQIEDLSSKLEALEGNLSSTTFLVNQIIFNINVLYGRLASLEDRASAIEDRIAELADTLASINKALGSMDDRITGLEADISEVRDSTGTMYHEIQELRSSMNSLEGNITELKGRITLEEERYRNLTSRITELEAQVEQARLLAVVLGIALAAVAVAAIRRH